MAGEPGTTNCPSCDAAIPSTGLAVCPACGFRLVATTDAQVLLSLLRGSDSAAGRPRGGGPAADQDAGRSAPALRTPADAMPTERIPVAPAHQQPTPQQPMPQQPMPQRAGAPAPLGVDPLLDPAVPTSPEPGADPNRAAPSGPDLNGADPAGPPMAAPTGWGPAPRPASARRSLADRLGELPMPAWLFGPGTDGRPNRAPLLLGAGLVVLILGGALFAINGLAGGFGSGPKPVASAAPAAPVVLSRVDPAGITAKASSTLHPETRGYQARNTLDGRDNTAWNSDGDKIGDGVGVALSWAFAEPQHVRQITVRNGYVRSSKDAEVFRNNGRIKKVRITADGRSTEWTLKDTASPQSLTFDLGTTSKVGFEVLEVYPGAKYKDLALTDITFQAAG